jgi:predicted amidohydrolase
MYVANWPKPRIAAWDILLKARSVENLCYTIGVNRVGLDASNYEYNGHSEAYDCLGKKLTNIPSDKEFIEIITLQKDHLDKIRTRLNFLNDQDSFEILD